MSENMNMTTGKPMRLLVRFALPLMFANVFQQLYSVVDTTIVARGVGLTALAALGTIDWLNWMIISVAQGYTQGFSVRISQSFGRGDIAGLKKLMGQSARLSAIIAFVGLVLCQLLLPLFLFVLRVPEELTGMASTYLRIITAGFPAVVFFNYCSSVLRAIGNSKTPLIAMIIASLTNIVLDILAVFWLGWGIAGAAAATVTAQCLSGLICAVKIKHTKELHFDRSDLKADKALSKDLIGLGTPIALKNIIVAVGGMVVQAVVNGFDMSFIAGYTATNKLFGILEIAAISYGYAITTYVGQNFGAKQSERIRKGIRSAILLSIITSLGIAAIMIIFGRQITMLFISSEDMQLVAAAGNIAYRYLCVLSFCLPLLYVLFVYLSAIQGLGEGVMAMNAGVMELIVRVIVSFLVALLGGTEAIYAAEVLAWVGSTSYLMYHYYRLSKHNFNHKEAYHGKRTDA